MGPISPIYQLSTCKIQIAQRKRHVSLLLLDHVNRIENTLSRETKTWFNNIPLLNYKNSRKEEERVSDKSLMYLLHTDEQNDVHNGTETMFKQASENGFTQMGMKQLAELVYEWNNILKNSFLFWASANNAPLRILIAGDVKHVHVLLWNNTPNQKSILSKPTDVHFDTGHVNRNTTSKWACTTLPIRKYGPSMFKMTPDLRPVSRTPPSANDRCLVLKSTWTAMIRLSLQSLLYALLLVAIPTL